MARVPYITPEELTERNQDLLARDITLNRALANSPGGSRAFWTLGYWIRRDMRLDPRLRELAILAMGVLAQNPYEYSHHVKIALESGVSETDIEQLGAAINDGAHGFSVADTLVFTAAREVYDGPGISAATFERLGEHFDSEQLIELCVTLVFYLGAVRLLASLDIDVEPEYQGYLERFPLPTLSTHV
tara:strand:+ start:177 stop:740 length:564 start_codon:yes stop_codon:yes gene_type:complete